jgi:hypothetical protein
MRVSARRIEQTELTANERAGLHLGDVREHGVLKRAPELADVDEPLQSRDAMRAELGPGCDP